MPLLGSLPCLLRSGHLTRRSQDTTAHPVYPACGGLALLRHQVYCSVRQKTCKAVNSYCRYRGQAATPNGLLRGIMRARVSIALSALAAFGLVGVIALAGLHAISTMPAVGPAQLATAHEAAVQLPQPSPLSTRTRRPRTTPSPTPTPTATVTVTATPSPDPAPSDTAPASAPVSFYINTSDSLNVAAGQTIAENEACSTGDYAVSGD